MRVITENILCLDRPYINLKKLSSETAIRKGSIDEKGLKTTYIINQNTQNLFENENYTVEVKNGIEKQTYNTATLNNTLLVDINYVSRTGSSSAKLKIFVIIDGIKYALPYGQFEDIYDGCFEILARNFGDDEQLTYINYGFKNLEKEVINVDINTNLERLADFKDVVDYKRNIDFFVLNNILASISKFDIKNKKSKIEVSDKIVVLRYQFSRRLYEVLTPAKGNTVNLAETDIICDLTDVDFPIVNMYTAYGLAKLVDIKNNVIPTTKNTNLFANILDLGLPVLR
ncbi:MAG: hypothetical protein ACRC6T_03215 [Sarcina sp.]